MKKLFICWMALQAIHVSASVVNYRSEYCQKEPENELKIKMEDLAWGQSLETMDATFNEVYRSGKRLEYRAYVAEGGFVLPVKNGTVINLSETFINSVISHIETALKFNYADHIFFSDMGHSHLYVDIKTYREQVSPLENTNIKAKYEIMFNHPKTKFLYHTAEQLKMKDENKVLIDDRKTQWRFFTRNIVGNNLMSHHLEVVHAFDNKFNTSGPKHYDPNEESYRYWGAGFNISSSKNGCFSYTKNKETLYFDISLYDINYNAGVGY